MLDLEPIKNIKENICFRIREQNNYYELENSEKLRFIYSFLSYYKLRAGCINVPQVILQKTTKATIP